MKYIFYLCFFHFPIAENRLHYPMTSSPLNGVMASPTATRLNSEHQLLNQMQHHQSLQLHQRHQTASNAPRLPPDLLPYGQHQSLALKNSLNNSSNSSGGSGSGSGSSSGGSTVIIDHRTQTYSSNNKYEPYTASYDDDVIDAMRSIGCEDDDGGDSDSGRLFLSDDEPDLRIYHHDIVGGIGTIGSTANNSMKSTATPKPFSLLGSSCTTTMTIASGKTTTLLPSHRFKNYELSTPSSATTHPSKNNNYPFYNNGTIAGSTGVVMTSAQQAVVASMHSNFKATESVGSTSTTAAANCKPRQSIVRTSPSFSFLSTGYHQQQDNFL